MQESATSTKPEPEFAALVAIDWADRKHCWELLVTGSDQLEKGELKHTVESVHEWAMQLDHRFNGRPVAVALEQSHGALVYQLSKYPHLVLYPVHPNKSAQFRLALYPSGAKSDPRDTSAVMQLLRYHRGSLRRQDPDTPGTRLMKMFAEQRRELVDEKTRLSNRMTALLKIYFPQALDWIDDIDSPMGCDFLDKWPNLEQLQKAKPNVLAKFFREHNCRSEQRIQDRITAIYEAHDAIHDPAMREGGPVCVGNMVRQVRALAAGIADLEHRLEKLVAEHPDAPLFASFPGLGPVLLPRVIVAFGDKRDRFENAGELQCYSGIAPITKTSGHTKVVQMRHARPHFLCQTFVEWAGHTIASSQWARAFYDLKRSEKMEHFAIIRELAFKWQRIAMACRKKGQPYDEQVYMDSLRRRGSPLATRVQWTSVAGFSKLTAKTA